MHWFIWWQDTVSLIYRETIYGTWRFLTLYHFIQGQYCCNYHWHDKLCLLFCSVLDANNEQCPFKATKSHQETCFSSSFAHEFYKDSINELCQYVIVFFLSCFKSCVVWSEICYFLFQMVAILEGMYTVHQKAS